MGEQVGQSQGAFDFSPRATAAIAQMDEPSRVLFERAAVSRRTISDVKRLREYAGRRVTPTDIDRFSVFFSGSLFDQLAHDLLSLRVPDGQRLMSPIETYELYRERNPAVRVALAYKQFAVMRMSRPSGLIVDSDGVITSACVYTLRDDLNGKS